MEYLESIAEYLVFKIKVIFKNSVYTDILER